MGYRRGSGTDLRPQSAFLSVSYAKADQAEFEQYHQQVIEFLRGPHAAPFLWKHLGGQAHEMMDSILNEFNE